MQKLFDSLADLVVPGIVFIAIAAILTGGALFAKMGQRMQTETEDFADCADTKETEKICERAEPKIRYAGKKVWKTGETIPVGTSFLAEDAEGNPLPAEVKGILDAEGRDVLDCYEASGQTAVFSKCGVYTFQISAMDGERKTAFKEFSLVVDSR